MSTFLVALEIEAVELGHTYDSLPLHCTVMHWFRTDGSVEDVYGVVGPIAETTPVLELASGTRDLFGPSQGPRDLPVNRLHPTDELSAFHRRLLDGLDALGVVHTEEVYTGEGFVFHVIMQHRVRFDIGQTHMANVAYVAEALDQNRITSKIIKSKFALGGGLQ